MFEGLCFSEVCLNHFPVALGSLTESIKHKSTPGLGSFPKDKPQGRKTNKSTLPKISNKQKKHKNQTKKKRLKNQTKCPSFSPPAPRIEVRLSGFTKLYELPAAELAWGFQHLETLSLISNSGLVCSFFFFFFV